MFRIEQILKHKKILEDRMSHDAKGCEDLIKKSNTFMAERIKLEETVKVLKELNIS